MASKEIFLKDYQPPRFLIDHVELDFDIQAQKTLVSSRLQIRRNGEHKDDLILDGVDLKPVSFRIDGKELDANEYELLPSGARFQCEKDEFVFEVLVEIDPENNLSCEGMYKSGDIFCTQNEAQGFRKITYFLDRPDVMACYTTTIRADKSRFPILLANGNKVNEGVDANGKPFVVWEDPFPKPAYLFALVAGDLGCVRDSFTTRSGRNVALEIYVDHGNEDKCDHAMLSLKNAMKWDEDKFGLEYDLDIYMIVAVDSFNMGAMENKGLNIFNSAYVLAKPETATDDNFQGIEGVIGHEYFHNWTGNRVTCRDWFQLTLKEGLTVFRDQEFSADMLSRPVKRIDDVIRLRNHQFPEDQGPMSHPIQPKSYIEINNFYTATVYEKGAEVIRMIHTLLGEQGFRKGMDLYFKRHDGQAVTTEDFVNAMADANNADLSQFKMWYDQNGTPRLKVMESYDQSSSTFTLQVEQKCQMNNDTYDALHMPLHIGLFTSDGNELPVDGKLELKQAKQEFVFSNIEERPILSLNRGFCAPVLVEREISDQDLIALMANESDEFARYEAAQTLYRKELERMVEAIESKSSHRPSEDFFNAYEALLCDKSLESAYLSYALTLPSEGELDEANQIYKIDAIHQARGDFRRLIAERFEGALTERYNSLEQKEFSLSAAAMGERALRQTCLSYLSSTGSDHGFELARAQFDKATNMTEEYCALQFLVNNYGNKCVEQVDKFYQKWKGETLVMQKWLGVQASSSEISIAKLQELEKDPVYNKKVPNLVRSLVGAFAMGNRYRFNHVSGDGYAYVADKIIEVDGYNPQLASRIAKSMNHMKRLDPERKNQLAGELNRILSHKLSDDSFEVVDKNLNG